MGVDLLIGGTEGEIQRILFFETERAPTAVAVKTPRGGRPTRSVGLSRGALRASPGRRLSF
jgi:hypothetical protein